MLEWDGSHFNVRVVSIAWLITSFDADFQSEMERALVGFRRT